MKIGEFTPALQPVKTYIKPLVQKSPDEFVPAQQEPLEPIKWGGVSALVGGVGVACGLSAAGLGAASGVSAFVVGGLGGFALVNQGIMSWLGGKDESAAGPISVAAGLVGGLAAAGGAAYLAASSGSPTLGLAVGVASSAATLGAGLWWRHHDSDRG
jgi:hypothetical protein